MPEELRIVVVDQGGPAGGPAGGAVAGRGARAGTTAGVAAGGALRNRVGPPPLSPSVPAPPRGGAALGAAAGFGGIRAAQGLASRAAAGNVAGAATAAAGLGASALGGPVGIAVAATVGVFVVAGIAVKKFVDTIESETNKLAGFSLALSIAQSQTQISRQAALRRRAGQIGPQLAAAEHLRSQFETKLTDLNTEMLKVLLEIVNKLDPLFQVVLGRMDAVTDILGDQKIQAEFLATSIASPQLALLKLIWNIMTREVEERDDDKPDPFAEAFMKLSIDDPDRRRPMRQPIVAPGV